MLTSFVLVRNSFLVGYTFWRRPIIFGKQVKISYRRHCISKELLAVFERQEYLASLLFLQFRSSTRANIFVTCLVQSRQGGICFQLGFPLVTACSLALSLAVGVLFVVFSYFEFGELYIVKFANS